MPDPGRIPRLDVFCGIPFLTLSGTYREMGLQYGSILKNRLAKTLSRLDEIRHALVSLFPFFIRPLVAAWLKINSLLAERKIPEDYLDELRGAADASGLPYGKLLFASTIAETLIGFGCTSILSSGKSGLLHSRNLDFFPPFLGEIPLVVNYRPEGKIPYTLVGFVGYLPGLTGMNAEGISLSLNESSCVKGKKNGKTVPAGFALRRILEECPHLADVNEFMQSTLIARGWTLACGSTGENNGAIFDITGDGAVRNALKPRHVLYSVNTFVNEKAMRKFQFVSRAGHAINYYRKRILDRSVSSIKDARSAIRVLSDYGGAIGDSTVNNYRTLQTVVMDAQRGRIWFSSAPAYAGLSAFYQYDTFNGRARIFLRASRALIKKNMKDFIRWMDGLYRDPAAGLETALNGKECSPFQMEAVFFLKDIPGVNRNGIWQRTLFKIEKFLRKNPGHAQFHRWKGECLFRLKDYAAAVTALEHALKIRDLSPYDRMACHAFLSESYRALKRKKESVFHAGEAFKITRQYAAGPAEKKLIAGLKSLRHSLKMGQV